MTDNASGSRPVQTLLGKLEQAKPLDRLVDPGQRLARLLKPGKLRDALHGVWLGHPVHPALVQVPIGTWLSATLLDLTGDSDAQARKLTAAGMLMSMPAAISGATDWSEQHEQQMRVGVVHALANVAGLTCYGASLLAGNRRTSRQLRLAGLVAVMVGGKLGGYISFRLAGGANHSEAVPHLVEPSWHSLGSESELAEGTPVRRMLGEVPVVLVKNGSSVHALADRCSHMSGSLAEGELSDGCLTCPWHGSTFSVQDGSVMRGPATSPQPSFLTRVQDGQVQVCLADAG